MAEITQIDEQSCIRQIQDGDRNAIRILYDAYRTPCLQWMSNRHRLNMEDLVDIYQEAMIVLYRHITQGKLDDRTGSLKTYLFAICQNMGLKKWAKSAVENNVDEDLSLIADWELNVGEHLVHEEWRSELRTQIGQLGSPCREIVLLYYYDKNSIGSIQQKMGYKSEEVVRTQKKRCLTKLRAFLKVN